MEKPAVPECKCHLSLEGKGLISCPSCGFGKAFDFKGDVPKSHYVLVKCKCGNRFETLLEVRQHYRKEVKLPGQYTNMTSRRSSRMVVENISLTGIGIRVMGVDYFEIEDLVKLAFELDNSKKSEIVLKGAVRHFNGNFVGCKILEISGGWKEFGFYLLP